jgi:hypothetical protein
VWANNHTIEIQIFLIFSVFNFFLFGFISFLLISDVHTDQALGVEDSIGGILGCL